MNRIQTLKRIKELEADLAEARGLLRDLLNCGGWYHSALEIDTYAGWCGRELRERIKGLLPDTVE